MQPREWSARENELIRRLYVSNLPRLRELLHSRSLEAIRQQARKLDVRRRGRPWTTDEVKLFRTWWEGDHRLEWMAPRLGRTPWQLYVKAIALGMLGVPDGHESLTAAARRVNYEPSTLRKILRAAGVRLHQMRTVRARKDRQKIYYRVHYVDPFDVDEAVAKWVKLESVAYAARSRRIRVNTLYRWLEKAGVIEPAKSRRELRHYHLDPAVIDRVIVAERRASATRELLGK